MPVFRFTFERTVLKLQLRNPFPDAGFAFPQKNNCLLCDLHSGGTCVLVWLYPMAMLFWDKTEAELGPESRVGSDASPPHRPAGSPGWKSLRERLVVTSRLAPELLLPITPRDDDEEEASVASAAPHQQFGAADCPRASYASAASIRGPTPPPPPTPPLRRPPFSGGPIYRAGDAGAFAVSHSHPTFCFCLERPAAAFPVPAG